jgi:hypothetical protein
VARPTLPEAARAGIVGRLADRHPRRRAEHRQQPLGTEPPYIRKEFGIEIAPQHFSNVKSQLKKRGGGGAPKGKPGRKPKAAAGASVEGYLAPPPKRASSGEPDLLAAMEAMKPLVASLGADKVKRIVDLLG